MVNVLSYNTKYNLKKPIRKCIKHFFPTAINFYQFSCYFHGKYFQKLFVLRQIVAMQIEHIKNIKKSCSCEIRKIIIWFDLRFRFWSWSSLLLNICIIFLILFLWEEDSGRQHEIDVEISPFYIGIKLNLEE